MSHRRINRRADCPALRDLQNTLQRTRTQGNGIQTHATHHSSESSWKPKEIPLGDDRILVLDAD
ncbi:MAG: hypothetical protein NTX04_09690 [Verrucomicrobia bacterium]|nr:hypothetical protein [Verrucomicrobiota bacterium]